MDQCLQTKRTFRPSWNAQPHPCTDSRARSKTNRNLHTLRQLAKWQHWWKCKHQGNGSTWSLAHNCNCYSSTSTKCSTCHRSCRWTHAYRCSNSRTKHRTNSRTCKNPNRSGTSTTNHGFQARACCSDAHSCHRHLGRLSHPTTRIDTGSRTSFLCWYRTKNKVLS